MGDDPSHQPQQVSTLVESIAPGLKRTIFEQMLVRSVHEAVDDGSDKWR